MPLATWATGSVCPAKAGRHCAGSYRLCWQPLNPNSPARITMARHWIEGRLATGAGRGSVKTKFGAIESVTLLDFSGLIWRTLRAFSDIDRQGTFGKVYLIVLTD